MYVMKEAKFEKLTSTPLPLIPPLYYCGNCYDGAHKMKMASPASSIVGRQVPVAWKPWEPHYKQKMAFNKAIQ